MNYHDLTIWNIVFSSFLLITCSVLNSIWFVFRKSFSWNVPNFFNIKVFHYIRSRNSIFYFVNHKNFCSPTSSANFCKSCSIFLYFDILTWSRTSNVRSLLLFFCINVDIFAWIYISRLHFDHAVICIVAFMSYFI